MWYHESFFFLSFSNCCHGSVVGMEQLEDARRVRLKDAA